MKNKNSIIIIVLVTFAALAVIVVVLFTGFFGGKTRGESVISVQNSDNAASVPESDVISEPDSIPTDTSVPNNDSSDYSPALPNESSEPVSDDIGQKISTSASALIGVPFAENGDSPGGFDNSGFIYYVLRENGYITCPRTTLGQSQMGAHIEFNELKAGDLVFFGSNGEAEFGGIYIGNGQMIACLSAGLSVRQVDITSGYYKDNFAFGIGLS